MSADEMMRILVVGRFGGVKPQDAALQVDPADLDAVLAARDVRIRISAPNHLGGAKDHPGFELPIRAMRDFRPRAWASLVPGIAEAFTLRKALCAEESTAPEILTKQCAPYPYLHAIAARMTVSRPASEQSPDSLDRILGMVESSSSEADKDSLAELDELIARQLAAIHAHSRLLAIERAWAGLRFLLSALEPGQNCVRVSLLDVAGEERQEALRKLARSGGLTDDSDPPDLIVLPAWFSNEREDLERLCEIAAIGSELHAPVLAGVNPSLFGLKSPREMEKLSDPHLLLENKANLAYANLRQREEARWLVLAFPDILLGEPEPPGHDRTFRLSVVPHGRRFVWGNPVWGIAHNIARSQQRTNWPCSILGRESAIEGLALAGAEASPLAVTLDRASCESLEQAGVASLAARIGHSEAFSPFLPTAQKRKRLTHDDLGEGARLVHSLPFRLLEARLARRIESWLRTRHLTGKERCEGVRDYLEALLADTGDGALVTARLEEMGEESWIALDLRLGKKILGGAVLEMRLPLGTPSMAG